MSAQLKNRKVKSKSERNNDELKPIKKESSPTFEIHDELSSICEELQELVRYRGMNLKSRIILSNRLGATIRVALGYSTFLDKKERDKIAKKADKLIKEIREGKDHELAGLVKNSDLAAEGFDRVVKDVDKEITKLAKKLPVVGWVTQKAQAGFGVKSLGIVIGSTGDLRKYSSPCKVGKRMGMAPLTYNGQTMFPYGWKVTKKKLPAEVWTEFGDSPQRRAIMYVITDCLVKLNHGIYREKYDSEKIKAAKKHPDWTPLHVERHSRMVIGRLLLFELWKQWNPSWVREFPIKERK